MANMKLNYDERHYVARAYAKAAHMEMTAEGMEESEYWCGVRVGIRKVVNEVFKTDISARARCNNGKLMSYIVYFDYDSIGVTVSEIGGFTDAR